MPSRRVAPADETPARRRAQAGWTLALGILLASLGLRIWHRGDYVPGWDVLSAAQGLHLVSTATPRQVLSWYLANHWSGDLFWNMYGVPSVLLPGVLASVWPWPFWNHVVTFAVSLAILWLLAAAFRLGWRHGWVVVLAWSTSSALVSQSVAGLAYLTCVLPHALAVCVVRRLRERPVWTALLGGVVYVVAWQGQDLGRTAFLVFLFAAVTMRAPASTRLVWLATGGLQAWDALRHPTANTTFFSAVGRPAAAEIAAALGGIGSRLFVTPRIDLPVLAGAGMLSLLLVRRERWLWRLLFLAELALAVDLALKRGTSGVWPRRFLLVDFYALVPVVALFAEWSAAPARRKAAAVLVGVLVLGAGWQLADTAQFVRTPFDRLHGAGFTLPFVRTSVDYQVVFQDVDWGRLMLAEARAGRKLILAYNLSSYEENATNPSAVMERLYLALGPERFFDTVYVFGEGDRWTTFTARPIASVDAFVNGIQDPRAFVGWIAVHPRDQGNNAVAERRAREMKQLLSALARRFVVVVEPPLPGGPSFIARFTLRPHQAP
jgi:hypothetical protein